jgi:DNA-binding transcriptional regulator YdaS (Cro superfamily)
MTTESEQVNLPRGTAARLARRFKLSHTHVNLVIKGERKGKPSLEAAIERERQRQIEAKHQSNAA